MAVKTEPGMAQTGLSWPKTELGVAQRRFCYQLALGDPFLLVAGQLNDRLHLLSRLASLQIQANLVRA